MKARLRREVYLPAMNNTILHSLLKFLSYRLNL